MKAHRVKILREGDLIAEVDVENDPNASGWGPYLSVADAQKLDNVRAALAAGDTRTASRHARIYRLVPVSAA